MSPKRLVLGACAALAVLLGVAMPASADDGTPDDFSWDATYTSPLDQDWDLSTETTPVPPATSLLDPAQTTEVSPPSQQQIDDARNAMQRINQIQQGKQVAAPAASVPQEEAAVVSGGTGRFAQADWWMVGAGAFLLLVMVELIRGIRWRPRPRTS